MDKSCLVWIVAIIIFGSGFFVYSNIKSDEAAEKKRVERQKQVADSIAQAKKDAESKKPCNRIGKYVYVDYFGVVHAERNCGLINFVADTYGSYTDEDGNEVDANKDIRHGSGVKRIMLKDFNKAMLANSCHDCIDDDMYEYLMKYGTTAKSKLSIFSHSNVNKLFKEWEKDGNDKNKFKETDIDPEILKLSHTKALAKKYGF